MESMSAWATVKWLSEGSDRRAKFERIFGGRMLLWQGGRLRCLYEDGTYRDAKWPIESILREKSLSTTWVIKQDFGKVLDLVQSGEEDVVFNWLDGSGRGSRQMKLYECEGLLELLINYSSPPDWRAVGPAEHYSRDIPVKIWRDPDSVFV